MKRYYRKDGSEYLLNGKSLVRASLIRHVDSPVPGRVVKIMVVQKVLRGQMSNPIRDGALIGISFPSGAINVKDYVWTPGEEFQVPFNIQLEKPLDVTKVEGDPDMPGPDAEIKGHSVCQKCGHRAEWAKEITGTHRGWCPVCQKRTDHKFER